MQSFNSRDIAIKKQLIPTIGLDYTCPDGISEENAIDIIDKIITVLKSSNISIRQAQHLLSIVYERVLDFSFN